MGCSAIYPRYSQQLLSPAIAGLNAFHDMPLDQSLVLVLRKGCLGVAKA